MDIQIRRFKAKDAKDVSHIIKRNLLEINTRDYPLESMKILSEEYNDEKVLYMSEHAHSYVATLKQQIVGCGSIAQYWNRPHESIILSVFVKPELHGQGIGQRIISQLENDIYFLEADRIEIPASITAYEFYKSLGYNYKDSIKQLDDEGHYRLEKFNKINDDIL